MFKRTVSLILLILASFLSFCHSQHTIERTAVEPTAPPCSIQHVCFVMDELAEFGVAPISTTEYAQIKQFVLAVAHDIHAKTSKLVTISAASMVEDDERIQKPTSSLARFKSTISSRKQPLNTKRRVLDGMRACWNYFVLLGGSKAVVIVSRGPIEVKFSNFYRSLKKTAGIATVGIDGPGGLNDLRSYATKREFGVMTSSSELMDVVDKVSTNTCNAVDVFESRPKPSERPKACLIDAVCFAIQGSEYVSEKSIQLQKDYIRNVSLLLAADKSKVRFTAHVYGERISPLTVGDVNLIDDFLPKIDELEGNQGPGANIFSALHSCYRDLFTLKGERLIVLVSDGNNTGRPLDNAQLELFYADIGVFNIAVGEKINFKELKKLPSDPRMFISVNSFRDLSKVVDWVRSEVCYQTAVSRGLGLLPTTTCGKSEIRCEVTFLGTEVTIFSLSRLEIFKILPPGNKLTTPTALNKFTNSSPGFLHTTKVFPRVIGQKRKVALRSTAFVATSVTPPYSVSMNIANVPDAQKLKGKCIRVHFKVKSEKGIETQCAVFKISRG